ncbi:fructosamine-3-kinase [Friedmanniella endophytica]|uniref:Fructosamine-3-kinase n=1 Tax=Microlunatus kandeliicorticis TaxID=1759536 RepID=A0A7W3ISU0_9ACTN|nr:fructosamine-3-kinase [Microlunatus kandeliicorticis]
MAAVGGGSFGRPYRVTTAAGDEFFAKVAPPDGDGMLAHEAAGLRWLAEAEASGGTRVARVVVSEPDLLVLDWVPGGTVSRASARRFGAALAATHALGAPAFGALPGVATGFIASEPLPDTPPVDRWSTFWAEQRLRPFLDRAVAAGAIGDEDADAVRAVADDLDRYAGPDEPPARVHGDLWSGNVLWTEPDAVLIDPSAHGGHRESDLAMLALFGLPHLDDVLEAYQRAAPLAEGWERRVPLHQLYPLLVHAVLFGGHYGRAAGATARTVLAAA